MTPPTRGYKLMREAALSLAVSQEFTRPLINPRQSQPYTYAASPLTSFPNRDAEFKHGPGAGAPLCNRRIAENDYLLDHLGPGFSGLYFSRDGRLTPELEGLFAQLALGDEPFMPIVITDAPGAGENVIVDKEKAIFAAYGADYETYYLVRPDRHVCARWKQIQTKEVLAAFHQALGET